MQQQRVSIVQNVASYQPRMLQLHTKIRILMHIINCMLARGMDGNRAVERELKVLTLFLGMSHIICTYTVVQLCRLKGACKPFTSATPIRTRVHGVGDPIAAQLQNPLLGNTRWGRTNNFSKACCSGSNTSHSKPVICASFHSA